MAFWQWSKNAAVNSTADPSISWAEGMPPSAVNDSARAMMARLAEDRDDISGLLQTGGSSTAYTVATNQGLATTPNDGQLIAFSPHATNDIAPTLAADGGTAFPIQSSAGNAVSVATLVLGSPYMAKFSVPNLAWMLLGFYANPFSIPLASGIDYWGASVPNSNFAFPAGQAISRTTYAGLFSLVGIIYGGGDGSTTFNLPDKTGRVSAMKEAVATRLTSTYFGGNSTTLGANGGVEKELLGTGNIPTLISVNASQNISVSSGFSSLVGSNTGVGTASTGTGGPTLIPSSSGGFGAASGAPSGVNSISATYTNGSPTPVTTVQPTIICNYIMRII